MNLDMAAVLATESAKLIDRVPQSKIFYWDWELSFLGWLQGMHTHLGDKLMQAITHLGDEGIIAIILCIVLLLIPETRKYGAAIFVALVLSLLITNIGLKNITMRTRPIWLTFYTGLEDWKMVILQNAKQLVDYPVDYSFPSGHSSACFAAATPLLIMLKGKRKWLGVFAVAIAALIAFSRLYVFVHWPTDVLVGMLVGIVCGILSVLICSLISKIIDKKKASRA